MWDSLGASGLQAEAAQPKRPIADAPTQQPMQANIKPAQRKRPTGDQKKVRRQMRRSAASACPYGGEHTVVNQNGYSFCTRCGWEPETDSIPANPETPYSLATKRAGVEYGPEGFRTLHCDYCGGAVVGDYEVAGCSSCGKVYSPIDKADATRLGLRHDEVVRVAPGSGLIVAVPAYATLAAASDPKHATNSTTTSKESTAMTAQPTEADLLTRLAAATTLAEQTEISAQIEALRTARRETVAQSDALDWNGLGALPPTHMQASAHHTLGNPTSLPPATASMRLGHSEATDWLDEIVPTSHTDAVLTAQARSQATLWFEGLWDAVKQTPEEFSAQAHNAAVRTGSTFGLQSHAARSVFLDQVRHLASREGLTLKTALDETVDTYVSDGRTTQPVGVDPDDAESMDEWGISSDANGNDPKSTTTTGDAPSLKEGDTPETGTSENLDNPNYGQTGQDASSGSFSNDKSDRMNTQSAAAPKGTCAICGEPMEQEGDGSWSHNVGNDEKDHEAKPGKSSSRKTAISLTNVGIEGEYGVGTDPNGDRVKFRLSEKDKADLKAVLYSDLAVNFSGVDVEESDIVKDASRRTAGEYAGGSPKAGDTATCHADGKPIEFFDGAWYHLKGGPSHNGVYPPTKSERESKESGLDAMFAAFARDTRSIQTLAGEMEKCEACGQTWTGGLDEHKGICPQCGHRNTTASLHIAEDSTSADGLSSADAPEEAPSLQYGDAPETGHSEPATQNPGEGASDASSATESDRPGGGVNWTAARRVASRLAAIDGLGQNSRTFATSLSRMASLEDSLGGVSARQVLALLLAAPDVPAGAKHALRTAAEGQTCSVCGDKIAQDPNGEDPSTWHHDNGEKHDHEAKPGGGESKESRRRTAARECQWTRVSEPGEDDGLTWWECSTHGKTEMGGEDEEPSFPCEGWLDENAAENPYTGSRKVAEQSRPLYEIAADIKRNWPNVYFGAVPYLDALGYLSSMDDRFGEDDAATIVHYLLSNMGSKFRGPEADRLKSELKALVGRTSSLSTEGEAGRDPFSRSAASDTGSCAVCGGWISHDKDSRKWTHDSGEADHEAKPSKSSSRRTAADVPEGYESGTCATCGADIVGKGGKWIHDPRQPLPGHPEGSVAGEMHAVKPLGKESARRTAGRYEVKKFQGGPGNMWGVWDSQEDTWHDGDHSDAQYAAGIPYWRDEAKAKAAVESLGGTTARLHPSFARRVQAGIDKVADAYQEAVRKGMMMGTSEFINPGAMLPSSVYVVMEPGPNGARPTDRKTTSREVANEWARELLAREGWSPYTSSRTAAPRGNDFSISDAKNEDGEWVMSPEEIRAEMNYSEDPGDEEDRWYAEGSRRQSASGQAFARASRAVRTAGAHYDASGAWKAQVAGTGESTWSGNGVTFDTPEEAKAWIADLSMKWFGFDMGRVVPSDTPTGQSVDPSDPQITHNFR